MGPWAMGSPCEGFSQSQLDELQEQYRDTFSESPGLYGNAECNINLFPEA